MRCSRDYLMAGFSFYMHSLRHLAETLSLPPWEYLLVVSAHSMLWQWASILFISGTIVTILGLVLLATQFRDGGDRAFSSLEPLASFSRPAPCYASEKSYCSRRGFREIHAILCERNQ